MWGVWGRGAGDRSDLRLDAEGARGLTKSPASRQAGRVAHLQLLSNQRIPRVSEEDEEDEDHEDHQAKSDKRASLAACILYSTCERSAG